MQGAAGVRSSQGLSRYPHGCLGMVGSPSPSGRPRKCHDSVTRAPRCPLPRAGLRSPVGDGVPGRAKALGQPQPATAPLRVPRVPATASRRQSPAQVVPCWIRHLHGNPPAQAVRAREMPSPRKRGGRAGRDAQPGTARTAGTPPVPPAPRGTPPRPAARPCPRHRGGGEGTGKFGGALLCRRAPVQSQGAARDPLTVTGAPPRPGAPRAHSGSPAACGAGGPSPGAEISPSEIARMKYFTGYL